MKLSLAKPLIVPAMTEASLGQVRLFEKTAAAMPQIDLLTTHVLHAGLYSRTIMVPPGVRLAGALIKIPTLLIVHGRVRVYRGEDVAPLELHGYNVLTASAGRKQAFVTLETTHITMVFPTSAKTVEEAEKQFTDEVAALAKSPFAHTTITGE